jgi:RND family efflux transporter MFP subunit
VPGFLSRRRILIPLIVAILVIPAAWLYARTRAPADDAVVARVKRGDFLVTVSSTGELSAPKVVKIKGPDNAQQAEQYQFKIASLVPEGTIVKTGDVVANLDRAQIAAKLQDVDLATQKAEAEFQSAALDSALNLSKAREDMRTASLSLEEAKLTRDQSEFEAPSVKRQAAITYEKALRALRQDSLDLQNNTEQAVDKMKVMASDLTRQQNKLQIIKDVMTAYTITAPAPGMVIYLKDWDGKKKQTGSMISSWDPTVATLPDLSQMESVTYVNEIDVRKVAVGQKVKVSLDADPTKKLGGTVFSVANAGEQRPNSDAKVFEVHVTIENPDTTLRPGMTTGNAIQTYTAKNVMHVPLDALFSDQGVSFVYRKIGGSVTRQEVERGAMNDDEVILARGVQAEDQVLLTPPADHEKLALIRLPGSTARSDTGAIKSLPPAADSKPATPAPAASPPTAGAAAPAPVGAVRGT